MTANIRLQYADGSTMNVELDVHFAGVVDIRESFNRIVEVVREAVASKRHSWAGYWVKLNINIAAPWHGSDVDWNLVHNAVCRATGQIPESSRNWRVV